MATSDGFVSPLPHNDEWIRATKSVAMSRLQQFCLGGSASEPASVVPATQPATRCSVYRAERDAAANLALPEQN